MKLSTFHLVVALAWIIAATADGSFGYEYETKSYDQLVDHFGFSTSDATFKQYYLINDTWWKKYKNGPIFFYTGNEGNIEDFAENSGFMWDIAPEYGALVVFAEHRYYGKSQLKKKWGNGYLSSEQALADFAKLIDFLKWDNNGYDSPVIAFGGSYGGMLAAWLRIKYPHICDGAIAASAPVNAFDSDCQAQFKIITEDFAGVSENCRATIQKSWNALNIVSKEENGQEWIKKTFNLCQNQTFGNDFVTNDLFPYLTDVYYNLAMTDYPYPNSFLANLPANPVNETCHRMETANTSSTGDKKILEQVAAGVSIYDLGDDCVNFDHQDDLGADLWGYQACSEMVMPSCTDGVKDMFYPNPWNFTAFTLDCQKNWKVTPQPKMADIMYGGQDLKYASNIVFSNGNLDPWQYGGILWDVNPSVVSVYIQGGAHHLDLRASNPKDPQTVIDARNIERKHISKWIDEANGGGGTTTTAPTTGKTTSGATISGETKKQLFQVMTGLMSGLLVTKFMH